MLVRIPKNRDDVVTLKPGFDFRNSVSDIESVPFGSTAFNARFMTDLSSGTITVPEWLVCEHGINLNAQRCPKCQPLVEKESD